MNVIMSLDFVAAARRIHDAGYAYIWGAKGQIATEELLQACIAEANRTGRYTFTQTKINFARLLIAAARRVTDCSGLLTNAGGFPVIGSSQIWEECTEKGELPAVNPEAEIPQIAGLVVYRPGHIGMFLGDGWVVESGGYSKGVVYTKLSEPATGTPWTGYGKWKRVDYSDQMTKPDPVESPTPSWSCGRTLKLMKTMQTGDDVMCLQIALTGAGFPCGKIDGEFGPKTDKALRAWQEKNPECGTNGKPDGKAAKKTIEKLGGTWTGK